MGLLSVMESNAIKEFINESNAIEGILDFDMKRQYQLYTTFMHMGIVTVADVSNAANTMQRGVRIRDQLKMDVKVGNYTPPPGGPFIIETLKNILNDVSTVQLSNEISSSIAWNFHCAFECLHPLTDCNGRVGRLLWFWIMSKYGWKPNYGTFLQTFYYQTLEFTEKLRK